MCTGAILAQPFVSVWFRRGRFNDHALVFQHGLAALHKHADVLALQLNRSCQLAHFLEVAQHLLGGNLQFAGRLGLPRGNSFANLNILE
jgi:hypothetical protein